MKKSVLTLICIAGVTTVISKNTGVGSNLGQDRTGSPIGVSTQCNGCHGSGSFAATIDIRMKDTAGNTVSSYIPGATYTYEVELTASGAQFGMQTVGLLAASNAQAGSLTAISSNTKITTLGAGRKYGEQTARTSNGLFQMSWIAPAAGSGTVNFYAAGVAVNSNGSTSGDTPKKAIPLVLTEFGAGVTEVSRLISAIWPNPANEQLQLEVTQSGEYALAVMDLSGKKVMQEMLVAIPGKPHTLNTSALPAGCYVLSLTHADQKIQTHEIFIRQ